MKRKEEVDKSELNNRIVYTLLLPVVRLAFVLKTPIKTLGNLLQMAYYHETQRNALKMKDIALLLNVSMRKVALLSKQLKQNFLHTEAEHGLPRRIEFMLWAGPQSFARILQAVNEDKDEVAQAINRLLKQKRIVKVPGPGLTDSYKVVKSEYRLVRDTMLARMDGLQNLLVSVSNAVYARFLKSDDRAFARTVSLRIRKESLNRLNKLYEEEIWKTLLALDEEAEGDTEAEEMDISILWAPCDFIKRANEEESDNEKS